MRLDRPKCSIRWLELHCEGRLTVRSPLSDDVMIRCVGDSVFGRVSVSFSQAVVMKAGFPVLVVVPVGSNSVDIKNRFVVF